MLRAKVERLIGRRATRAAAAATAAGALVAGCMLQARVDPSWAPLRSGEQRAAMMATLAMEAGQRADLPRFAVEQEALPSGLRVGVESAPARGMVAVVLAIGAGSSADPPERDGLAHLVEHLVYHAHGKGQPPESDQLLRLGASYNAATSLDATRFHEVAPAAALPALLALADERLTRPLAGVDEADFDRERSIVENELNQRNELGVYGQVVAWMQRALFPPGHPYARPIGGSAASLRRLTLADARRFAATHYRADNATLLVAGEIGGRSPLATVAARLPAGLKARDAAAPAGGATAVAAADRAPRPTDGTPPAPATARPHRDGDEEAHDTLRAAVATPEIWLAYDLGAGGAEAGAGGAEPAVRKILTANAAEAIVRQRLAREPDVLGVSFLPIDIKATTMLACQIVLERGRRRAAIAREARNLIWALWSDDGPPAAIEWDGWRQETVVDLRTAALADAVLSAEPFVDRALARSVAFQTSGAADGFDRVLGAIAAARPHDVSSRAFTLLAPERARTLFLDPLPAAERPPPGAVGVRGSTGMPAEGAAPRAADLGTPPRVPPPAGLDAARSFVLPGGLTVMLVPRPQFPSVTALLGFRGGAAALPAGVLELVRAVEPRHGGGGDAAAAALQIEKVDRPGLTADLVHTDRRHLSTALYLLADRISAIAETNWARILTAARRRPNGPSPPDEPRQVAAARLRAALYGAHPYARRIDRDDLREMDPDAVARWLPQIYNARNGLLVIAGDIEVDAAARLAAGWFGDWRGAPETGPLVAPPVPPPEATARETVLITPRPVTSQVEVTFACRLAPADTPRALAAQRMLAGLLGGELLAQIRERAGAAYSVDADADALAGGGAQLVVTMPVDSRRLGDALRILREDRAALAAGRIDGAALGQVRWSLTREASLRFQTGQEIAEEVVRVAALGFPPESLAAEADELLRVREDDVARAYAPCEGSAVLSLVGDEALIRAAL
jgi:zinc protease